MILQALAEHYEALVAQGKLERPGWNSSGISYVLYINDAGELEQAVSIKEEKTKTRPMSLPAPVKRTVQVAPNFLWDNSSYILGIDEKGKPQRSLECFTACKKLHHALLDGVDSPAARALLAFFDRWDPTQAREHPALTDKLEDILAGSNLVFRYHGTFLQDDPLIRAAWQDYYDRAGDGPELVCIVTGKKGPVEAVHPAIKGLAGAQSSGAALVSFNGDAFCSYGREQNLNAPTSKYAAFAYTSALNYLLADREHVGRIGDTTVLFWAAGGQSAYQGFFMGGLFGESTSYSSADLQKMMLDLCQGKTVCFDETQLNPDTTFYVLGLSPNAARLSVRFFLRNSFGSFIRNVQAHQELLKITRPAFDKFETLSLWKLLDETVNQNSRDKSSMRRLAGETLRAILNNTPYPATLLNGVTMRIRAEQEVTPGRAAILKAYYLKNSHPEVPKEVLTVSLNSESTNIPYTLGRLFSVYEDIQLKANPGINATIKDKYFNSAASTPASIFPLLGNLAQKHLRKLRGGSMGLCVNYEKLLSELASVIGEEFPPQMTLPQQGSFQLGYYQQTQARYIKKEENKNA